MLKAIAAALKHDLGLPGGMLAEDAALKYQVARPTLFLRLKDWRVGKYVLPTDTSNRSEAQMKLSPKADEKIRDWALLHWLKNDTQTCFKSASLQPLLLKQNQGLAFKTEDGLPANGWWESLSFRRNSKEKKGTLGRLHGSKSLEVACRVLMFFSNFKLNKKKGMKGSKGLWRGNPLWHWEET